MQNYSDVRLIAGNSNPELAKSISNVLGIKLADADISRFPDGESKVQILDNVRGLDCFVIQSLSTSANENLMELLIIVDALKRASAGRITAVVPYVGYSRSDRKDISRTPIVAKLTANLLTCAGISRMLAIDLHSPQCAAFYDIPCDHLSALPVLLSYIKNLNIPNLTILSPDAGRMKLTEKIAQKLSCEMALINKVRKSDVEVTYNAVVGNIKERNVLIADDMISTAGTIAQTIQIAKDQGALDIFVSCTHPILCGRSLEKLSALPIKELIVCDTIPVKKHDKINIKILSVAPLLAKAITNIHESKSLSHMFEL